MGGRRPPKSQDPPGEADTEKKDSERPTLVPDFDPQAFARDSEMRQRAVSVPGGEATIEQARRLHLEGEHEEALFLLSRLLDLSPMHAEARRLTADCRAALEAECLAAIGSEGSILVLAVSTDELKTCDLDNVSGFLVSLMDGATTVESILDVCGLPRLLALRHLRGLVERGVAKTMR